MVPAPFIVVVDANVLFPLTLRDTVLRVAKKRPTKQGSTSTGRSGASAIDRDRLRAAVRRLGDESVF